MNTVKLLFLKIITVKMHILNVIKSKSTMFFKSPSYFHWFLFCFTHCFDNIPLIMKKYWTSYVIFNLDPTKNFFYLYKNHGIQLIIFYIFLFKKIKVKKYFLRSIDSKISSSIPFSKSLKSYLITLFDGI